MVEEKNIAELELRFNNARGVYSQLRIILDYVKMTFSITREESDFLNEVGRNMRNAQRIRNEITHKPELFDDDSDDIHSLIREIGHLCQHIFEFIVNGNEKIVIFDHLRFIYELTTQIAIVESKKMRRVYNSEDYYKEAILEIERNKQEVQQEVQMHKDALEAEKKKGAQSAQQVEAYQIELSTAEVKLKESNDLLDKYKTDLEERKKRDDAVKQWNTKIINVFKQLDEHLQPIKNEHTKLVRIFYGYQVSVVLITLGLFALVTIIACKIAKVGEIPTIEEYIGLSYPIPFLAGLLWGFITQMNRVQNQMVILSKHIHEVKYTEGLLMATNELTVNISDSTNRINVAIDKLLAKHLADNSHQMGWEKHVKDEEKALSSNELVKILKEIKGLVTK